MSGQGMSNRRDETGFSSNKMEFKTVQYRFAAHLRDPEVFPAPVDIEDRRLAVYRDLVYNNIESFIRSGFPILHKLLSDEHWHSMVRDFIRSHSSHSPYFLQISEEFLNYLQEERGSRAEDPPFLLELAHYEWVELALDVSCEHFPPDIAPGADLIGQRPVVSPLAWSLSYQYPVHRIGPHHQPAEPPPQPTFLIVYRDRDEQVQFMESNAVTARLLSILDGTLTGHQALATLAEEMRHPQPEALLNHGKVLLEKLQRCDIICGVR
jgi:uncharacterized protein